MVNKMNEVKFDKELVVKEIINFLQDLEWSSEKVSPYIIRTFYQGDYDNVQVFIKIQEDDICLLIDPLIQKSKTQWGKSVVSLVNIMKEKINHIDIGIDHEGDLFLKVNLLFVHIDLERFQCLLLGLCQVAENVLLPLLQANAFDNIEYQK